jgi:SMI1/KNR4 family protein SUKH-1
MTIDQFFRQLEADRTHRHIVQPGATDAQLKAWNAQNPGLALPADFIALLRRANGLRLAVKPHTPTGAVELLPLERIQFAPHHMYRGDTSFDQDFPRTWLAITDDPDGSRYLILDTSNGEYLDIDPIDAHSPDVAADDVGGLLDWLAGFLDE